MKHNAFGRILWMGVPACMMVFMVGCPDTDDSPVEEVPPDDTQPVQGVFAGQWWVHAHQTDYYNWHGYTQDSVWLWTMTEEDGTVTLIRSGLDDYPLTGVRDGNHCVLVGDQRGLVFYEVDVTVEGDTIFGTDHETDNGGGWSHWEFYGERTDVVFVEE